ncbi:MAG: ThiF family adenylyltransferase [Pseudodesulfovibrio sp.]
MTLLRAPILELAADTPLPQGGHGPTLDAASVLALSDRFNLPGWEIEAHALELGVSPLRYLRNASALSPGDHVRLLRSRVALVGLGGLGGSLLEQCLRLGIGRIRAADGDIFEESNLNRQALASMASRGLPKAAAALDRAENVNPSVQFEPWDEYLTAKTLPGFLLGCDLVMDALGGLGFRPHLQAAAARAGIPLVTGALAGWTGYVGVVLPGQPGPADSMGADDSVERQLGCPMPTVALLASLMAAEAVRILCGTPSPLSGKILIADLRSLDFEIVAL